MQTGQKPSVYATFYENRDLWVNGLRRMYAAWDEVNALSLSVISPESWTVCRAALRSEIRAQVKEASDFGLLLFLV